ncbi:MAG: phage virion morphogenesis protein [Candidatus Aenigmatarchaeota archaeon]
MPGTSIKISNAKLLANLSKEIAKASNPGPALKLIGMHLERSTLQTFEKEGAREGSPKWKDLAPSTIKSRRQGPNPQRSPQILSDNGYLKRGITHETTRKTVKWGPSSGEPYGIFHQKYGPNQKRPAPDIPRRAYLNIFPSDVRKIREILRAYFMGL